MKEKTTLRRRWWFTNDQCQLAEKWLTDLAMEGWRLKSVGFYTAVFKSCEPDTIQYKCINTELRGYLELDMLKAKFAAAGWQYIDYKGDVQTFCSPKGIEPPAGYANTEKDMPDQKKQRNQLIKQLLFYICILAVMAVPGYFLHLNSSFMVDSLLISSADMITVLLIAVWLVVCTTRTIFRIISLPGRKDKSRLQHKEETVERVIRRARRDSMLIVVLVVSIFSVRLAEIVTTSVTSPLSAPMAVIQIADIDGRSVKTDEVKAPVYYSASLLCPYQVELYDSKDESKENGASYNLDYRAYRALEPDLAALLADLLVKEYSESPDSDKLAVSIEAMGFNKLWLCDNQDQTWHMLIALRGNEIYKCTCCGTKTAKEMAAVLNRKLQ
jgi:hypothetical protein